MGVFLALGSLCFSSYTIKSGSPSGGSLTGGGVSSGFGMSGGLYGGKVSGGQRRASAAGPAHWEFKWQGNEESPYQVVVKTTVTIQAESWQFGSSSPGAVSVKGPQGLATVTTSHPIMGPGFPIGWYIKKVITGTVYSVVSGTESVSLDVPMFATASSSSGSMAAQAWCSVSLHPALISFGDSVAVSSNVALAPIGGRVNATASIQGLSNETAKFCWVNSGGRPFDAYVVAQDYSSAVVIPWTSSGGSTKIFYFRESGIYNIICQISIPSLGVLAYARTRLDIDAPKSVLTTNLIGAHELQHNASNMDRFKLLSDTGFGRQLGYGVLEPDSVLLKNGTSAVTIVQMVKPRTYTVQEVVPGIDNHDYGNSPYVWGLDHQYPYCAGFAKPNSLLETIKLNDSPGFEAASTQGSLYPFPRFKLLKQEMEFQAFLMFEPAWPSGSMPVTLQQNLWSCSGKAERSNLTSPWQITHNNKSEGTSSPSTEHPVWTNQHLLGQ